MSVKNGLNGISDIYEGNTPITKIYLGNDLLYKKTPTVYLPSGSEFNSAIVDNIAFRNSLVFVNENMNDGDWRFICSIPTLANSTEIGLYYDKILQINYIAPIKEGIKVKYIFNSDCKGMFKRVGSISIDFGEKGLCDTSEVNNMSTMFQDCTELETLNLSGFVTSKLENISNMCIRCGKLKSINVSNWNTSSLKSAYQVFYNCTSLTSIIGLSSWDVSNVEDLSSIFQHCAELTSLDLSNWYTPKVKNTGRMFSGCTSLVSLFLSRFSFVEVTNTIQMFNDCHVLTSSITVDGNKNDYYPAMFNNCSTARGTKFTVNYKLGYLDIANALVATKSDSSNVVLGSQID